MGRAARRWWGVAPRQPLWLWALRAGLLLVVCACLGRAGQAAEKPTYDRYAVAAALLQKFALFVEWPAESTATNSVFTIGILGEDPFGEKLERVLAGKQVRGQSLSFRRFTNVRQVRTNCQVLFIAGSENARLPDLLKELKHRPILTVGDTPVDRDKGVIVNLALSREGTLHFEINADAAAQAGLSVSSQLLELASKVHKSAKATPKKE